MGGYPPKGEGVPTQGWGVRGVIGVDRGRRGLLRFLAPRAAWWRMAARLASPPPPSEQQPIAIPDDPITEQPDDPEATLLITVDDDGSARLGETKLPTSHADIVEAIRNNEKAQADGRLAIRAAPKVPYGRVISLMSAAREAGVTSVGLASERL